MIIISLYFTISKHMQWIQQPNDYTDILHKKFLCQELFSPQNTDVW